jgi:hypothetical protein
MKKTAAGRGIARIAAPKLKPGSPASNPNDISRRLLPLSLARQRPASDTKGEDWECAARYPR